MVSTTIESYALMFSSDGASPVVEGEETKFVLALCGIITSKTRYFELCESREFDAS